MAACVSGHCNESKGISNMDTFEYIFITGATGVLGSRLLVDILEKTSARVLFLSRESDKNAAMASLYNNIKVYKPEPDVYKERLLPVLGDVASKRLGLTKKAFNELAEKVDFTFHCAANVSLVASYSKVYKTNVEGTSEIIKLCLKADSPLLYTSSFSVIGDQLYHEVTLKENELDIGQNFPDMGYERSKFEAEQLIHKSTAKGLKWLIVRPGNIWGDSKDGAYPLYDTKVKGIYYEMVKSLVETGYAFSSSEDFDITPVDYVSGAILHITRNFSMLNHNTFHLMNSDPITFNDLVQLLIDYGYEIRSIDNEIYFSALAEDRLIYKEKPYRSLFTDLLKLVIDGEDIEEKAKFDTSNIRGVLEGTGIACADSNMALLKKYFDYCILEGFLQSPDSSNVLATIENLDKPRIFMEDLLDAQL